MADADAADADAVQSRVEETKQWREGEIMHSITFFKPRQGALISYEEMFQLVTDLQQEHPARRLQVTALAPDKWTTLKSFSKDLKTADEFEEYMLGFVKDVSRFNVFFQVTVYMLEDV